MDDTDDDHKRIAPYILANVRRSGYVLANTTITAKFCHTDCASEATDDGTSNNDDTSKDDDYYNETDDAAEDCVDLDDTLF